MSTIAREGPHLEPGLLQVLAEKLSTERGIDLLSYKPRVLKRRLLVRLRATACADLSSYLKLLEADPGEAKELQRALAIQVSGFFRNPETYEVIRRRILPALFTRARDSGRGLVFFSAGCAGGEEPFSLAMLVRNDYPGELGRVPVRIVGLDQEPGAFRAVGEDGYEPQELKDLPAGFRDRYFSEREGRCFLAPELRGAVEFIAGDLTRRLPVAGIDLAMCRNVLIYFQRPHQELILGHLYEALSRGGYLVLGKTETMLGPIRSGFSVLEIAERVYAKAGD